MSKEDLFAQIDAFQGNTMIVFDDLGMANSYVLHQHERGLVGMVCRVEDTRTGSGLLVQWRDAIPAGELARRQREALWLLEEVLAGRVPRPIPRSITDISAVVEACRRMHVHDDPDHREIPPEFRELMNTLAQTLDDVFNPPPASGLPRGEKRIGFFLTCFEFSAPGRFNYISNAEKLDVKQMLQDIVARIEARERMDAAGPTQGPKQ